MNVYPDVDAGQRRAAASDEAVRIDYNALSVAAMTLTLILMVDFARDRLDRAARQRPFFRAVLEGVYTELATLGFVEFLLHLISEYYEKYDAAKKHVFGDVHFLLFYAAILNAFQTVLTAVMTSRVAHAHWVTTELLELYHYVELREEFDRVSTELDRLHRAVPATTNARSSPTDATISPNHVPTNDDEAGSVTSAPAAPLYDFGRRGLTAFVGALVDSIRYPTLRRKYAALLTQVRFHELRMHFLHSYNLPLQFKVSDYLMRSKHNVLLKFVNVSSTAWLLLTAGVCLLYYVLGMIYHESLNQELVGACLTWIFFGGLAVSSLALWVVSFKMHFIFHSIMHHKALWDIHGTSRAEQDRLAREQMSLFWVAEPKNVLEFVQFLQFAYSLAIATVVVFWEEINDGAVAMHWFVVAVGLCYVHYVFCSGTIIPMFILCTSLGQLVDETVLHATVALYRLDEAKQKQLEATEEAETADLERTELRAESTDEMDRSTGGGGGGDDTAFPHKGFGRMPPIESVDSNETNTTETNATRAIIRPTWNERVPSIPRSLTRHRRKSSSDGVAAMRWAAPSLPHSTVPSDNDSHVTWSVDSSRSLSSPRLDASDDLQVTLTADQRRTQRRHARKKSLSDGVAVMARLTASEGHQSPSILHRPSPQASTVRRNKVETGDLLAKLVSSETTDLRTFLMDSPVLLPQRPSRVGRQKSVSEGVASMRTGLAENDADNVFHPPIHRSSTTAVDHPAAAKQRHSRKKSLSDGVAFMSHMVTWAEDVPHSPAETLSDAIPAMQGAVSTTYDPRVSTIAESFSGSAEGAQPLENGSVRESSKHHPDAWNDSDHNMEGARNDSDHNLEEGAPIPIAVPSADEATQLTFSEQMYAYFLSKQHVIVSNVFGTIAAFFSVGQRIEGFIYSDDIPDYFVSLHLPLKVSFLILLSLLTSFLIASALVVFLFRRHGNWRHINELTVLTAAAIDVVIALFCLVVLIVAESNRCCHDDGDDHRALRYLAEKSDYPGLTAKEGGHSICSCPMFGRRSYGGLGTVEPYTSLVLLRIVRHWLARRIAGSIIGRVEPVKLHEKAKHTRFAEHDKTRAPEEVAVSVVEAWETVVGSRPDLVAAYGEFSSEVLCAMLGVAQSKRPPQGANERTKDDGNVRKKVGHHNRSFSLNQEYAGLSEEAQEVILAGKLGRSLMRSSDNNNRLTRRPGRPVEAEEHARSLPSRMGRVLFQIDTESESRPLTKDLFLTSPNARLVCTMRRCERKFLPILDKWAPVDVAVTRFEILYLDAVGVDDIPLDDSGEGTRQALIATMGGKGLRLCDVAHGRRVVGRLSLSDIVSLHVERVMPRVDDLADGDIPDAGVDQTEFWIRSLPDTDDDMKKSETRAAIWKTMAQDLLKIETVVGHTLFLRFYADADQVNDAPVRLSAHGETSLENIHALQWAQTIGRVCGRNQLKQPLPHLGESTTDELRDYLVVVEHLPSEGKGLLSRANSFRSPLKRIQSA